MHSPAFNYLKTAWVAGVGPAVRVEARDEGGDEVRAEDEVATRVERRSVHSTSRGGLENNLGEELQHRVFSVAGWCFCSTLRFSFACPWTSDYVAPEAGNNHERIRSNAMLRTRVPSINVITLLYMVCRCNSIAINGVHMPSQCCPCSAHRQGACLRS